MNASAFQREDIIALDDHGIPTSTWHPVNATLYSSSSAPLSGGSPVHSSTLEMNTDYDKSYVLLLRAHIDHENHYFTQFASQIKLGNHDILEIGTTDWAETRLRFTPQHLAVGKTMSDGMLEHIDCSSPRLGFEKNTSFLGYYFFATPKISWYHNLQSKNNNITIGMSHNIPGCSKRSSMHSLNSREKPDHFTSNSSYDSMSSLAVLVVSTLHNYTVTNFASSELIHPTKKNTLNTVRSFAVGTMLTYGGISISTSFSRTDNPNSSQSTEYKGGQIHDVTLRYSTQKMSYSMSRLRSSFRGNHKEPALDATFLGASYMTRHNVSLFVEAGTISSDDTQIVFASGITMESNF